MKNLLNLKSILILFLCVSAMLFTACDDEPKDDPTPEPTASFTFSPEIPDVGEEVTFTATATDASSFTWSFGDANSSQEQNPTHTYTAEGEYEVTLIATGEGGSITVNNTVSVVKQAEKVAVYFIQNVDSTGSYTIQKLSGIGIAPQVETAFETTGYSIHATYDPTNELVYYSDDDNLQVVSNNLTGTAEKVVADGFEGPRGLALNEDGSTLFVADRFAGEILSVNIATGAKTVLYDSTDFSSVLGEDPAFNTLPVGLAFDNGQLYITCVEIGGEATWKGAADGSSLEQLNGYNDAGYGYGIVVDNKNSKLIFDDGDENGLLKQSDLLGGNVTNFTTTQDESKTFGLWIDEVADKVYWSTEAGYIQRANLDGSEKEDLSILDGRVNRGLFVVRTDQ